MDEARLIEWSRNRANRGIKAAISSPPPEISRYKLEREYAQTLYLCDALEASRERDERLKAEIQRYIDAEKAAAGPDVGTIGQSTEDVGRAARIAAFASVLYMIEKGAE